MKTRRIEMLICESHGDDSGSWTTDYVEIPANTKKRDIEKRAVKAMYKELKKERVDNVVHVAVYNIPSTDIYCCMCTTNGAVEDGFHLHQGKYICEECWDERLRVTE